MNGNCFFSKTHFLRNKKAGSPSFKGNPAVFKKKSKAFRPHLATTSAFSMSCYCICCLSKHMAQRGVRQEANEKILNGPQRNIATFHH